MNKRRYRKDLENQLEYIGLALGMKVGSSGDRDCLTIDGNDRMYRVEYVLPSGGAEAFFGPERRTAAELYEFLMFARIAIAKAKEKFEPKPAPQSDGEADLHFWAKAESENMTGLFTISKPGGGPICVDMPLDEAVGSVTEFMEQLLQEATPEQYDDGSIDEDTCPHNCGVPGCDGECRDHDDE